MKIGRTFITKESEQASRSLIANYLEQAGYKQSSSGPELVYERGSRLGSLCSFSTKHWKARAIIQIKPGADQTTDVVSNFDIDTTGQIVIKRERDLWENEINGLVAAVGGFNPHITATARLEEEYRLEKRLRGGANWFFWIAALSLVNSIMVTIGGRWNFLIGLGATQFIDGFAGAFASHLGPQVRLVIQVITLVTDLGATGLFALFGVLARKGYRWSFIVGMILYALDGLIFLIVPDFVSIGFHLFALYWIFLGLKAGRKLDALENRPQGPVT